MTTKTMPAQGPVDVNVRGISDPRVLAQMLVDAEANCDNLMGTMSAIMKNNERLKSERDKLLEIVELVAIGTTFSEFREMLAAYKNGEKNLVIERRMEEIYQRGFDDALKTPNAGIER